MKKKAVELVATDVKDKKEKVQMYVRIHGKNVRETKRQRDR